ncbi:MAG: alkaline phosphatase D family protein [Candidatus Azotimanducaceae bacterium]|uniref:Alkaline phosphatase family protein n=1 Tax=OM182 bacterium TaxID=2510334 RepID=A0A520S2I1_9GAMM|nr:alkaline phosphatase [Gammaproteobacteria bacterium]OUV68252.1 MAG: hypothetical protein CBC93_02685 [Gammaproteobacteria bacterium TMED133]RZO76659.1 MAG: alkaline phosphatase family protein [OM182 bacterium]
MKKKLPCLIFLLSFNPILANDFFPAKPLYSESITENQILTKIAFGSCFDQRNQDAIFDIIRNKDPDLMLMLGDNIYPDSETYDPSLKSLRKAYFQLSNSDKFRRLREQKPIMSIWDDHDYGLNDAGSDWPLKKISEQLFEYVWVPENDIRRTRDGIYFTKTIGPIGRRVQLIFLDTRFFRSPLLLSEKTSKAKYQPDNSIQKTMLGRDQWIWLEQILQRSAQIRLIVSSIQVIADGHGWEAWRTLPNERARLYNLLKKSEVKNVFFLSGDRHSGAIYNRTDVMSNTLWEVTSSSLNKPLGSLIPLLKHEPGPFRLGASYYGANFGLIQIDWANQQITLSIHNQKGEPVRRAAVKLR